MTKPMNILQVLPALHSGGVERGTLEIARALTQAGHTSHVISSGGPLVSELLKLGSAHNQLPAHSKSPWTIWQNAKHIAEFARRENIDLIHVRSRAPAWSCLRAARLTGIPMISTFHGQYGHQNWLKRQYNQVMLKGRACIAVSDFIQQHIEQCYPNHQTMIQTIHRGIDLDYFNADKTGINDSAHALRLAWKLPNNDEPIVLLPGRMTRLKGHQDFLEAIAACDNRDFHSVILGSWAGRERYLEELKTLTKRLSLQHRVSFINGCSDMPSAYQLADIVVSSSTKPESFGRTLCEAQAMRKLVVASDHGGAQETIVPIQKQGLYEPGNVKDQARALSQQLARLKPEQADQLKLCQTQSQTHIAANFTLDKMCRDTLSLYEAVIQE